VTFWVAIPEDGGGLNERTFTATMGSLAQAKERAAEYSRADPTITVAVIYECRPVKRVRLATKIEVEDL